MQNFPFGITNISFSAAALADLVFYLVTLVVGVVSIVMFFHWRKYGLSKGVIALTEVIYLVVCAVLISVAFFAIR